MSDPTHQFARVIHLPDISPRQRQLVLRMIELIRLALPEERTDASTISYYAGDVKIHFHVQWSEYWVFRNTDALFKYDMGSDYLVCTTWEDLEEVIDALNRDLVLETLANV